MRARVKNIMGVLSAACITILILTGCASEPLVSPTGGAGAVPAEYKVFYEQSLNWTSCGSQFQCATARAPLDWAKPSGPTITLALIRHVATGAQKLGSLFVNPGGPGGSGVNFIRDSLDFAVDKQVQAAYDVVGFDPRGVGASTPVTCLTSSAEMDSFVYGITPGERGSASWLAARKADAAVYAEKCALKTGDLLGHVDTLSAARDLDMMRSVVGDNVFNYLGYSYGTLLGATYADQFPTRVGRMVLDGALDPASTGTTVLFGQAVGFENELTAYLKWCLKQSKCPITASGEGHPGTPASDAELASARGRISSLLASLDRTPLTGSDGRLVGADTMLTAIITPLYSQSQWPALSQILSSTLSGRADMALMSADNYYNRVNGRYLDNSTEAFSAVNCLDYPVSNQTSVWASDAAELAKAAPVLGPYLAYGDALCATWGAKSMRVPAPVKAVGSPDILVVGTTGDPATPYQWAVNLSAQLPKGHLLTYVGEGHTAYNKGSSCVNSAVDGFLLSGKVPAAEAKC